MVKLRNEINKRWLVYKDKELSPEENKEAMRWFCCNDLYFLARLTGHNLLIDPFHKDLCDKVSLMNWKLVHLGIMPKGVYMLDIDKVVDNPQELGKDQRVFLHFRSAYKTTVVITVHTIQLVLNFPNIHIAICHNTQINASDILEGTKRLFLTTPLKDYFPEYIPNTKEWGNKTGFSVAVRTDYIMKGDNIEAIGIGTEVTGRKYHIFKNDDIVTKDSVTNEEQLKKSRDFLELHKPLFVNPTVRIEDYCGTKYHFADAYSMLEEDPKVEKSIIKIMNEAKDGEIEWEEKKYNRTLPQMHSLEGILDLMKDTYTFNCQYMLNPQDPQKRKFTEEMIQTYTNIPEGLTNYLVVDPADSEEKNACYCAMEIWGIDYDDNWYWLDGVFDKIDDRERIDEAIRLAKKWRVFEVLWENLSFGRTDERNFERASRLVPRQQRTWMVRSIGASQTSKNDRILGLNDHYSRRKVFWPERMMYYSKFEGKNIDIVRAMEYEFKYFPLCSHKDLLDAQSFLLQIDLIPGDKVEQPEVSKFAHIKDPVQRGTTETFWRLWDKAKENGFRAPEDILVKDNL